jgi:hypothetical protein
MPHIQFYLLHGDVPICERGRRDRNRMIVEFTTTYAVSAYHLYSCEFESRSWRDVLDTTLSDKVSQWLATGRWYIPGTPVSPTKTDSHYITDILLKVALNIITLTLTHCVKTLGHMCRIGLVCLFLRYLSLYIKIDIFTFMLINVRHGINTAAHIFSLYG